MGDYNGFVIFQYATPMRRRPRCDAVTPEDIGLIAIVTHEILLIKATWNIYSSSIT